MPLTVLISGAGIAGPALAHWLIRLGHNVTIVERSPELRVAGQQIDIKDQGIDAVERMGLMEEFRKHIVDEAGLQFVDSNGTQKALFAKEKGKQGRGATSEYEIMRGDFCRVLHDATCDKVEYRFGTSITDFKSEEVVVHVNFSDGTKGTYDLLVAADGQESRIRKNILGEEENLKVRKTLGVMGCYYTLDRETSDEQIATVFHAPQRRIITTRYHSETHGQAYLFTMSRTEEIRESLRKDISEQKKLFTEVFQDAGWQSTRLVEAMNKAQDWYAQEIIQIRSPTWSKDRVVLLGDAGYAPSPLTGMGTSLALIGAYILAGEISRNEGDVAKALEVYETSFRPFVEETQSLPRGVPGIVYPGTSWGISVLHGLLGFVTMVKLDKLFGWFGGGKNKWQLPPVPGQLEEKASE